MRAGTEESRRRSRRYARLVLLLTILVVLLAVRVSLVQIYRIPSDSMSPTLRVGDVIMVNRVAYRLSKPQYGDVVVFLLEVADARSPDALSEAYEVVALGIGTSPLGSQSLVKRVVGLPGDTLEGRDGRLWRNGAPVPEPYLPPGVVTPDFEPVQVPPGQLWVMGDNREVSEDSRSFGPITQKSLVGEVVVTLSRSLQG